MSGTALIVEDNLIIAMAAEVILLELGASHVGTAASVNQALASIDREKPDFALLDLNLGSENSIPVAIGCANSRYHSCSPPVMASGRRSRLSLPKRAVVQKPYTREVVEAALGRLREAMPKD